MAVGRVAVDWRKANVTFIFKHGRKKDPGNFRLVSCTLILVKVREQQSLEIIYKHMKDKNSPEVVSMDSPRGRCTWQT